MENRTVVQAGAQASVSGFLSRVFLWMGLGLAVSAAGSWWLLSQPNLFMALVKNQWVFFGLVIAEVGLVIWLSAALMRMSTVMASTLFFVYAFLNGITLAPIFLVYTGSSILSTFAITAGTFFFFSVYGFTTKKDLSSIASLCVMGLFGVILAGLVNAFLVKSTGFELVLTFLTIAIFLGLIAWDTQKLKHLHAMSAGNAENEKRYVVIGALALYLDFINLFVQLLRIFGKRR